MTNACQQDVLQWSVNLADGMTQHHVKAFNESNGPFVTMALACMILLSSWAGGFNLVCVVHPCMQRCALLCLEYS